MNVIKFEDVSKRYKLYSKGGLYLRDRITHALQRFNPFNGRFASNGAESDAQSADSSANRPLPSVHSSQPLALGTPHALERDFWALKNISFEIKQGESVGFIGRNGAGKSTILKLLAGVTKQSSGQIEVNGKVAALIEVGAGFHPELTGRENVYLNGSILGMKKVDLDKCFDSIVSYAELEEFIDTPVKYYSSGMYVRLGFSIAAHTNPDIFLIDEVLAVGDEAFQAKCLNTLAAHKAAGKTMILVSHSMEKVTEVCDRCIYVSHGEVKYDGSPSAAIKQYRKDVAQHSAVGHESNKIPIRGHREWSESDTAPGNDIARLCSVRVRSEDGKVVDVIDIRRPIQIEMEYEVLKAGHILVPNFHFYTETGACIFVASDHDPQWMRGRRPVGRYVSSMWVPGNFLADGRVVVGAALSTMEPVVVHFDQRSAVVFDVIDSFDGDSARGDYRGPIPGFVRPLLKWDTSYKTIDCGKTTASVGVKR